MKQNSTRLLVVLIAMILAVGTVVLFTKGLAFDLKYQDRQEIEIDLEREFDEADIRGITDEVFGKQVVEIRAVEEFKNSLNITTSSISEEQKNEIVSKINEIYSLELSAEDVKIQSISHIRGRDFIKPYVIPFVIVTGLILVYFLIRYIKLNSINVLIQSIGIMVLAQMVLLGIIAMTRMPIGNFTIPAVIFVYMFSTYLCTEKFECELKTINEQNKKK